jgi:hypothetical protein
MASEVLPSSGTEEVTCTAFTGLSGSDNASENFRELIASTRPELGFSTT